MDEEQNLLPERLRRLPVDHSEVVFRAPERFGTVVTDLATNTTEVWIRRHPSALTRPEKLKMVLFERNCAISKANYHDQPQKFMAVQGALP